MSEILMWLCTLFLLLLTLGIWAVATEISELKDEIRKRGYR